MGLVAALIAIGCDAIRGLFDSYLTSDGRRERRRLEALCKEAESKRAEYDEKY